MIAREFAVTALRLVSAGGGRVIARGFGKIKTASTMAAICVMLTGLAPLELLPGFSLNTLCVLVILGTTVWSGAEYFIRNRDMLNWKA